MENCNDTQGLIFNTQGYSIQDGPGMRVTVFVKGCPLRCAWCHNPESIEPYPELMTHDRKCIACGLCIAACRPGAITFDQAKSRRINREKCNLCFDCVAVCPSGALERVGTPVSVEEVEAEVEKDEMFYRHSGGGVTISGGEPLAQGSFVRRILQACKEKHVHTALDTSGYAPWSVFENVLEFVDLVLYDIKHMDPECHQKGTGVDNRLILDNLRRIPTKTKVWLRVPMITNYNDSFEHVRRIVALALEVNAQKISVLPYHELGVSKYSDLGRDYPFHGLTPSDKHLQQLKSMSENMGMPFTIGY